MKRQIVAIAAGLILILALTVDIAHAVTGTETFTVTAPAVLTVTPPAASVSITHGQTDVNQVFAAQRWTVAQNGSAGAAITFATNQPFTHATATSFKRNAKLDLALFSSDTGSGWSVTTATAQSNFAATPTPVNTATVAASATAPGDAAFDLTVTFIETDFSRLASGSYSTTVTATLTSN